jgi:hypothetical protein
MDKGVTKRLYGNYRAKVVNNKDKEFFGRVMVWIPDLMPLINPNAGIWARPANNPMGGRNMEEVAEQHFMGSSYIPANGSWVWIFFETGNINKPYYFGSLDIENAKVLPENQLGTNYEDKWTIFKSHEGRVIVVSDDPDDERIEVAGKKRQLTEPPSGDLASVYQIDDNMTTILFDERENKEKILIRSYKGDFIHFDIDERKIQIQIEDDVEIEWKNNFYLTVENDINLLSRNGDIFIEAQNGSINMKAERNDDSEKGGRTPNINVTADDDINVLSLYEDIYIEAESGGLYVNTGTDLVTSAGGNHSELTQQDHLLGATGSMHRIAGLTINHDAGGIKYEQSGTAQPAEVPDNATEANKATEATPEGKRDT